MSIDDLAEKFKPVAILDKDGNEINIFKPSEELSYDELINSIHKIANGLWKGIIEDNNSEKYLLKETVPYLRNSCLKHIQNYTREEREIIMQKFLLLDKSFNDYFNISLLRRD